MADITVVRAERAAGRISITGSNFTATTTTVFVDDDECPFELISSAAIELDDVPGATEVSVSKGEVELTVPIEEAPMSQTADQPYSEAPEPLSVAVYTPVVAEPITVEMTMTEQEKATVEDPAGPAIEPGPKAEGPGVPGRQPYPEGSPPDGEAAFQRIHGFARDTTTVSPSEPPEAA